LHFCVDNIFALVLNFNKLASDEEVPDTQRSPQFIDEELQAYEFMSFLDVLAKIKNQLNKVKDLNAKFGMIFGALVILRPGIIKNAIKEMFQSGTFDKNVYLDLKASVDKEIGKTHLIERLAELNQIIEIEMLYDEKLANTPNGSMLQSIKENSEKAIRIMSEGLHYL